MQYNWSAQLTATGSGKGQLTLTGHLNLHTVPACLEQLKKELGGSRIDTLVIDARPLESCDDSGFALLQLLRASALTPGIAVSLGGFQAELEKRFRKFAVKESQWKQSLIPANKRSVPEELGASVNRMLGDWRELVEFVGQLARSVPFFLAHPGRLRWREVARVFELAGANAVPIISLISVLIGLVIAFESAQPLAQFGAQIYVVNMIGMVMVRELGPLMAAIMLAGRSGSAFAAEIGTMKVNEELNALETFGLDPIRFLVIQRIVAGAFLTPLLTFYAAFMGVLGGVFVTLLLGFPMPLIVRQLTVSVHLSDVVLCGAKGVVFGVIVSTIGCLRGLQTELGPSAVGMATTRAVVTGILLIIMADALFAVLYYLLLS